MRSMDESEPIATEKPIKSHKKSKPNLVGSYLYDLPLLSLGIVLICLTRFGLSHGSRQQPLTPWPVGVANTPISMT